MAKGKKRRREKETSRTFLKSLYHDLELNSISVKGEFSENKKASSYKSVKRKRPINTAPNTGSITFKREIAKSTATASLILCLEIVLYFVWR